MATNAATTAKSESVICPQNETVVVNEHDMLDDSTTIQGNVSAIYARLPVPPMSSNNIDAWFISMDFWFTASGIVADKQKTATILAALDPNVIAQLADVIASMPPNNRYDFIKAKIINHFADSEQRRLNRLLSELPLGDKKPSELFYEMRRVAGTTLGEAAVKGLWTKRLPEFAQPVIAASAGTPAEYTKVADAVVEAIASNHIGKIEATSDCAIKELRVAIVELGKKFERLSARSRSRAGRSPLRRNRSTTHTTPRATYAYNTMGGTECWYHKKYASRARKCRSPCKHKQRNNVASTSGTSTASHQPN